MPPRRSTSRRRSTRRGGLFPRGRSFDDWYPPPSVPLPADGIRARSQRGDIGETWWSKRFIGILESFDLGARLVRGRRYARAGQVLDLAITPGEVTARVQGSRPKPYEVRIGMLTLPAKDWGRVEAVMASRAVFLAKLLAGEMPRDIEEAFTESRLSLFPATARDLSSDCSCPDWSNPCKHIAATYYLLAEAFDADPFLIFRWRGRDRDELLASLGASPDADGAAAHAQALWDVPSPDVPPLAETLDRFWEPGPGAGSEAVPAHPRATLVPDAILRGLDPKLVEVRGRSLVELLGPAYVAIIDEAERIRLGIQPA
jgi:uncharacterized Zn finger protein